MTWRHWFAKFPQSVWAIAAFQFGNDAWGATVRNSPLSTPPPKEGET